MRPHVPLPIGIIIAVGVIGVATMQSAGAQSTLVVSATGIDCQGQQLAYTSIQLAVNAELPGSTIRVRPRDLCRTGGRHQEQPDDPRMPRGATTMARVQPISAQGVPCCGPAHYPLIPAKGAHDEISAS
jgi:ketopantoate hydroxymethyltransferase